MPGGQRPGGLPELPGETALAALAACLGMTGPLPVHVLTYGRGGDCAITGVFGSEAAAVAQVARDERVTADSSMDATFPETPTIHRFELR